MLATSIDGNDAKRTDSKAGAPAENWFAALLRHGSGRRPLQLAVYNAA